MSLIFNRDDPTLFTCTRFEMRKQPSRMYWPPMTSLIKKCLNRDDSIMDVTVLKV